MSQELKAKEPRQTQRANHWPPSISSLTTISIRGPMPAQMGLPPQQPEMEGEECTSGAKERNQASHFQLEHFQQTSKWRPGPESSSSSRNQEQPFKSAQENCQPHWCAFSTLCSTEHPKEGPGWTHHCYVRVEFTSWPDTPVNFCSLQSLWKWEG